MSATYRVKVACCNWSHADAPHALAYVLRDDEMVSDRFFDTWPEALAWGNDMAAGFARIGARR